MTLTQYLDVPCEYCGANVGFARFSHGLRWQAWWAKAETKTGVSP